MRPGYLTVRSVLGSVSDKLKSSTEAMFYPSEFETNCGRVVNVNY